MRDRLLEFAVAGFAHHDVARRFAGLGRWLGDIRLDIALGPGGDDVGRHRPRRACRSADDRRPRARQSSLGCLAATKIWVALSMPTVSSVGECMISSALCSVAICAIRLLLGDVVEEFALDAERPAGERDLDLALLADVLDVVLEQMRDVGGIGRRRDGDDRLRLRNLRRRRRGPRRRRGCGRSGSPAPCRVSRRWSAARTRSATFEENVELAKSPSLEPRPVKSKRNTAMPLAASATAMRFAASTSLPQVKQCANSA